MKDHLARAMAGGVRAFAVITTNLVEEARQRHDCYPVAAAALGRTMTAALLMAANLKTEECLTIRVAGDGAIGAIVADAHAQGAVRGYVQEPHVDLPLNQGKLNVGGAVGHGQLNITRFTGMKQPFTGTSPLVSGEIGEDIANYLLVSEQTPSTVALGVLVNPDLAVAAAGGYMVQAMPGVEEAVLDIIEQNLAGMPPISQLVQAGADAVTILNRIFDSLDVSVSEPSDVVFYCHCSSEKVGAMLISLGQRELNEMIEEGQAEVSCHFCGEKYQFNRAQLEELRDSLLVE